jgi:hypothetical protein
MTSVRVVVLGGSIKPMFDHPRTWTTLCDSCVGGNQMTTARWVLVSLIAAILFSAPQSQAGDDDDGYRRAYRPAKPACVSDFWGRCLHVARHRHAYRWRYYPTRRRWNDWNNNYGNNYFVPGSGERIDHGLFCHARRRVIGEERPSKAKAERAADNAWMGAVRYDHGERYQDLNHAKDVQHNCDPSSTTTILKRVYFRCVVEATPCRAPAGSSGERVERRYEEETDSDDK